MARLDLSVARRAGGPLPGERRAAGAGAGTELAQLRPYEPGDDPRQLDPAASARTGVPHVRQHVPERALTTWIVLDLSASMAFGTGLRLKSDVAEGVADHRRAARRAPRRSCGLVTAGAPETATLPPRSGRGAFAAVRRLHRRRRGARRERPRAPAPRRAAARQPSRAHARAGRGRLRLPRGRLGSPLRALAQRHAVTAIEIADPREAELPNVGELVLVDPESGELVEADTTSPRVREAFAAAEADRRAAVAKAMRRARAHHLTLSTDADWLRELARVLR